MTEEKLPIDFNGIGSPQWIKLHHFGDLVYQAFGERAFLCGSALTKKYPRDIDVRVKMAQKRFIALGGHAVAFADPYSPWAAIILAFSALAKEMTGLSVDFQIQPSGVWNKYLDQPRLPLGRAENGDRTITLPPEPEDQT